MDPLQPKAIPLSGAESPTTAKPLEFDDEQDSEVAKPKEHIAASMESAAHVVPVSAADEAPPKPISKDLSPKEQAETTLQEAFPSIDKAVIRAVLMASGGKVEPAFNALLAMSDPEAHQEEEPAPPPKPPRPTQPRVPAGATSTPLTQLEADEMYARQLAEHYGAPSYTSGQHGSVPRPTTQTRAPRPKKEMGLKPNELYDDKEHSFIDDDLPVIKENIRQGFLQTQTKVNQWVETFRKKLDGDESLYSPPPPGGSGPRTSGYTNNPTRDTMRGNTERERERYDADPRVLDDDFAGLEFKDDPKDQTRPTRPLANPDLFKSRTSSSDTRRVSFQDPEVNDNLATHVPNRNASPAAKTSKWEPLTSIEPTSIPDSDPFSLGDSEDDKEKDIKTVDSERLKQSAAEKLAQAGGDTVKSDSGRKLSAAESVGPAGTRDKEAEEILTGKS